MKPVPQGAGFFVFFLCIVLLVYMRKIIYNSGAVIGDIKSERGKDETDIKIFKGVQKGMHLCSVI